MDVPLVPDTNSILALPEFTIVKSCVGEAVPIPTLLLELSTFSVEVSTVRSPVRVDAPVIASVPGTTRLCPDPRLTFPEPATFSIVSTLILDDITYFLILKVYLFLIHQKHSLQYQQLSK